MARLMAMVLRTRADRPARPQRFEAGETWRAEASRRGLRPAQVWRSPPRPSTTVGSLGGERVLPHQLWAELNHVFHLLCANRQHRPERCVP